MALLQDRIDAVATHALVGFEQSAHQIREVLRPSTNELGERIAVVVAIAEEHTIRT